MKILISPAKSINENCEFPTREFTVPQFQKEAGQLARKLKRLKSKDIMSLMHVSKDIADLNVQRNKNWYLSETPTEHVRPAGFLFTGEVYRGLDIASLSPAELEVAQNKLRILSGMYGLLKPLDLMYPYRLEMGTRFEVKDGVSNLYQFWGEKLTKQIEKETDKTEVVLNLASAEYAKAALSKKLKRKVITPLFKDFTKGEYKVIMMYAKHARGAMARYVIQNDIQDCESLKVYNIDGYTFDEKQSTETEWVFVR